MITVAALFVTVGARAVLVELLAPLKVRFLAPLYVTSVLSKGSAAVIVSARAAPAVFAAEPVTTRRDAAVAVTATVNRSAPAALSVPSVTAMFGDSTLYSFIEPPLEETPPVKVTAVVEPKLIADAALFVTVGAVIGLVELLAPLQVRILAAAYV